MKLIFRAPLFVSIIATFLLVSYITIYGSEDEELADKAVSLGYIAVAVDGFIRYGNPPIGMSGKELIENATRQNPDLLKPLAEYFLTARRDGVYSSVLLCDKEKKHALAEDAGCTPSRLDGRLWNEAPDAVCTFHLDLTAICLKK